MTATFGYIPGWALEQGMSHGACHLLAVLCWQGRKECAVITTSIGRRRLMEMLNCGPNSILRWVAELCNIGVLSVSNSPKTRGEYSVNCSPPGTTAVPDDPPNDTSYPPNNTRPPSTAVPDDPPSDTSYGIVGVKTGTTAEPRTDTDSDKTDLRTTTTTRVTRAGGEQEPEPTDTEVCFTIGITERELDRLREALRRQGETYSPLLTASGSNRNLLTNWEGPGKICEQLGWLLKEFQAEATERALRDAEHEELNAPPEVLDQRRAAKAAFLGRMAARGSSDE